MPSSPRTSWLAVDSTALYLREVGSGPPIIVLHGGPDFDHSYLLPDLDRLADGYHLIYYDQRGRGRSATGVRPEDVSFASDVDDVLRVVDHLGAGPVSLLGHSWGALLALAAAMHAPARVARLILLDPAPASALDLTVSRTSYLASLGSAAEEQQAIIASAAYQGGDPAATLARYRIHFQHASPAAAAVDRVLASLEQAFERQGPDGIRLAQAIEARLLAETWDDDRFDLIERARGLHVPTSIIMGAQDLIPIEVGRRLADAIPEARLVLLESCGHFSYLERPDEVRRAIDELFALRPNEGAR